MRARNALNNTVIGLFLELIKIAFGLIIPYLIIQYFGSVYNGLIASILKFLSIVSLMTVGIGGVARAALYEPLAKKDTNNISTILRTTEKFMKRVAVLFGGALLAFAIFYPLLILDEFDWLFSFSLVLILGMGIVSEYYFGMTYQILLKADQKLYIVSLIQIITTILNATMAILLIVNGFSIHLVKFASGVILILNPIVINRIVHKKYKLVKNAPINNLVLSQRWDAFAHQIAAFVLKNTDVILLTIFTSLKEISVFAVYNAIVFSVRKIVFKFSSGLGSAFGDMFVKKEIKLLNENFSLFELLVFSISTILFTVTALMLLSFVMLYTDGVGDVNYYRPLFGFIVVLATAFSCLRIPYQSVVEAVGHFKQTRNGAIFEAILNLTVSLLLIPRYGIVGAAIGTLSATFFRTMQYAYYLSKVILERSMGAFLKRIATSTLSSILIIFIGARVSDAYIQDFREWIVLGGILFLIALVIVFGENILFYKNETLLFCKKIKNAAIRKKRV